MVEIRSTNEVLSIKQVPKSHGKASKKWKVISQGCLISDVFFRKFREISICSLIPKKLWKVSKRVVPMWYNFWRSKQRTYWINLRFIVFIKRWKNIRTSWTLQPIFNDKVIFIEALRRNIEGSASFTPSKICKILLRAWSIWVRDSNL